MIEIAKERKQVFHESKNPGECWSPGFSYAVFARWLKPWLVIPIWCLKTIQKPTNTDNVNIARCNTVKCIMFCINGRTFRVRTP